MFNVPNMHQENQRLYQRLAGVPFALAYGLITHLAFQTVMTPGGS